MDVVSREEFEAVRDMAIAARDENDRLRKRIETLEANLAQPPAPETSMPHVGSLAVVTDGRQSEMALAIARGTRRLLRNLRFSTVTELPLASGRRADLVALATDGTIVIVEIKSSLADFRADQKWPDYRAHCDRLYFAISDNLAPEIMPSEAGLIVADAFGAAVLREARSTVFQPRHAGPC